MKKDPLFNIYFAPLQESTDYIYRSAYSKYFNGVDKYFAPYILRQNDGTVKTSHLRDTKSENNQGYITVPQILAGNSIDFVFLVKLLEENGYSEINWNLGCPYPMVSKKGLGSGLLPYPERIKSILEEALPQISSKISIKMRTGLQSHVEVFKVIDVLNKFPLSEIILHPRYGKQLYKGNPDEAVFADALRLSKNKLVYNGDIVSVEGLNRLKQQFVNMNSWMIGRGILKNPFLPVLLKSGCLPEREARVSVLRNFHDEIYTKYSNLLSGGGHQLARMEKFWSYFCYAFPDPHKTFKRVKKSANLVKYEVAVSENFQRMRYDEEDECRQNS